MAETRRTARTGEVARALGMSPATVQSYARRGLVPYDLTPGRQYRFNLDEVREVLSPERLTPVADLQDLFTATRPMVDSLSGYRSAQLSSEALSRLRSRGYRPEPPVGDPAPLTPDAGMSQLGDLIRRAGNRAAFAVLRND